MTALYLFFQGRKKRTAFVSDVLAHSEGLYRYALRLTRSPQEAEDLVQETLLKAYRSYGRTKKASNYRAWAYTILRNEFISRRRKIVREVPLAREPMVDELESPHDMSQPFSGEWRQHLSDEIVQALDQLGELHRSAILLCDVEGLTYEEISQVMQCPVGTVRSRIFHGRKQLRSLLQTYAKQFGMEDVHEAV